jgi:hypothetical protein
VTRSRFGTRLALIVAGGLLLRIGYVVLVRRHSGAAGDGFYYHFSANLIADGSYFVDPFKLIFAALELPSAAHPPLYTSYLSVFSFLGFDTPFEHRIASCVVGAATVLLLGLLGKRLAGDRAGLLAAGLAAVYPHLWLNEGQLAAETITAFTVALVLLAVERFRRVPTRVSAALVGGALALATLARAELALLFVLIAFPLILLRPYAETRARLQAFGVCALVAAVVLGPWVGWNLVRFNHPELVSSGFGTAVYAGTCDRVWEGSFIGYWGGLECGLSEGNAPPDPATAKRFAEDPAGTVPEQRAFLHDSFAANRDSHGRTKDESDLDVASRHAALDYVRDHKGRLPLVLAARELRIWNLYNPRQTIDLDATVDARGFGPARLAYASYFVYMALAIAGLVVLRRRGQPVWPYLMLAVSVAIAVAFTYGIQRFRIPVDTVAPVLAAVAIDAWIRRRDPQSMSSEAAAIAQMQTSVVKS